MRTSAVKKRLGDLLVDVGIISSIQLKHALDAQKRTGGKLGTILSQMGLINEEVMLAFLGKQCGVSYVSLAEYGEIPADVIRTVPESIVRHQNLIPIAKDDKVITIAMSDPFNVFAVDDIKLITGFDVQVVIASPSEIETAIDKYYSFGDKMESLSQSLPPFDKNVAVEKESAIIEKAVLSPLLSEAVKAGALKLFFEPRESSMSVRFRVDGYLKEQARFGQELSDRIVDYFARLPKLPGASRIFTESEIKIEINDKKMRVLVNQLPSLFGMSVSLSVINELSDPADLGELGFEPEALSIFKKNIEIPGGLILITGPAASGKSLTMYSAMKALNYPDKKIISFTSRAEYTVNGVTQCVVKDKNYLNAENLSAVTNDHEPDIVFIDDILDGDNAVFAVNTALTGRTVFATMNAVNALDALKKLIYKGIPPSLIASSLVMISNQKLMRVICPSCKETYELPVGMLKALGYEAHDPDEAAIKLKRSTGCSECNNTGYRKRVAVFEILEPDEKMKEMIASKAVEPLLSEYYQQKNFLTIAAAALRKVISGMSSMEEYLRLTKLG